MNNIKKLISQKESRKLEFKEIIPRKDKLIKTAIAFSNSQGGHLIIGINYSNKIVGIDEDSIIKYEEIISNTIYDNCYPYIIPEIYSVKVSAKFLLVCYFYPSNNKPHYMKSKGKMKGTYVRVGSSNRLASIDIMEELERQKRKISFDSVINYDIEYRKEYFKEFDKYAIEILQEKPTETLYEKFKFIAKTRDKYSLTNLGILLSGIKNDYFPMAKIECARFKGTSTKVFLDQSTFSENIVSSIERSISFVNKNIKLGATIGEVYRENRWEYPILAIREVIINAVVHRDYSIRGSDIKIAIFDDMIEITSPGVLIIDKEKLGEGYSELRNLNMGLLFKRLNIIEQWGRGYEKIKKELLNYPEIRLAIDDSSSFVQVKFIKTTHKTTKKLIIENMGINKFVTRKELAEIIGVSENAIKQHIANLKKDGIIERIGSLKSGYWTVKERI